MEMHRRKKVMVSCGDRFAGPVVRIVGRRMPMTTTRAMMMTEKSLCSCQEEEVFWEPLPRGFLFMPFSIFVQVEVKIFFGH